MKVAVLGGTGSFGRALAARLAATFSRVVRAFVRAAPPMMLRPLSDIYYLRT